MNDVHSKIKIENLCINTKKNRCGISVGTASTNNTTIQSVMSALNPDH